MRMTYVDAAWSKWIQSENAAKNILANAVGRFVWSKRCHYITALFLLVDLWGWQSGNGSASILALGGFMFIASINSIFEIAILF